MNIYGGQQSTSGMNSQMLPPFKIDFTFIYVCLSMWESGHMSAEGQKRLLNLLELELRAPTIWLLET